jgi:protein-S-isoprenylcysteine O-methyltransferase Ste14
MNSASGTPVALAAIQTARKIVLLVVILLGVGLLFVADSRWPGGHPVHESIEWFGIAAIMFVIVGRTWCSLYIGGRKTRTLVAVGPYSVCRNPLYVFSVIGGVGVGAQLGSFTLAAAAGALAWLVFFVVALKEEEALSAAFGDSYRRYVDRVPRFLPRWRLWRDVETLEIRPRAVLMTFVDACVFLVAIPVAEGFEFLHSIGALPVLFRLP